MISSQTYSSALTISVKAAEDIPQFRFVNYLGGICTAGERALGVSSLEAKAGTQATIETLGTMLVETVGAVSKGAAISSDTDGKAKAAGAGEVVNAYALGSCSGASLIKIRLVI